MKEDNKDGKIKKRFFKKKVITAIILFIIFIYILYAIYLLIKDPTDTFTVEKGTVSLEETVTRIYIKR